MVRPPMELCSLLNFIGDHAPTIVPGVLPARIPGILNYIEPIPNEGRPRVAIIMVYSGNNF